MSFTALRETIEAYAEGVAINEFYENQLIYPVMIGRINTEEKDNKNKFLLINTAKELYDYVQSLDSADDDILVNNFNFYDLKIEDFDDDFEKMKHLLNLREENTMYIPQLANGEASQLANVKNFVNNTLNETINLIDPNQENGELENINIFSDINITSKTSALNAIIENQKFTSNFETKNFAIVENGITKIEKLYADQLFDKMIDPNNDNVDEIKFYVLPNSIDYDTVYENFNNTQWDSKPVPMSQELKTVKIGKHNVSRADFLDYTQAALETSLTELITVCKEQIIPTLTAKSPTMKP